MFKSHFLPQKQARRNLSSAGPVEKMNIGKTAFRPGEHLHFPAAVRMKKPFGTVSSPEGFAL
jgi:hypothetical protein